MSCIIFLTYLTSLRYSFTVCIIASLAFEAFKPLLLIGIYFILFAICACIALQQGHKIHWVIQVLGLILFMLASADIAYTMWLLFGKFLKGDLLIFFTYVKPKYWLYVTNRYVFRRLLQAYIL